LVFAKPALVRAFYFCGSRSALGRRLCFKCLELAVLTALSHSLIEPAVIYCRQQNEQEFACSWN
jgi:hypothetical protein